MNFSGLKVKFVKNHINLDSSRPLFRFQGTFIKILNLSIDDQRHAKIAVFHTIIGFAIKIGHFDSKRNDKMRKLTRKIEEKHEKYRARS